MASNYIWSSPPQPEQAPHYLNDPNGRSHDPVPGNLSQTMPQQVLQHSAQYPGVLHPQPHFSQSGFAFTPSLVHGTGASIPQQHSSPTESVIFPSAASFAGPFDPTSVALSSLSPHPAQNDAYGYPPQMPYGTDSAALMQRHLISPDEASSPEYPLKQPRHDDSQSDGEDYEYDSGHIDGNGTSMPKPQGACQRCRGLKVRCEFEGDPFTCRRCRKGGHRCLAPSRKKRKVPPKREFLMGQIREQAAVIEDLMSKLEAANSAAARRAAHTASLSPLSARLSLTSDGDDATPVSPRPDVQEWITKARESFRAFDGLIGGAPAYLLEPNIPERDGSSSSDMEDDAGSDEVGIVVEGEAGGRTSPGAHSSVSHEGSASSSRGRTSRGGTPKPHAALPVGSAPYALIARMSLHAAKSGRSSRSPSAEPEGYGVADPGFFEAGSGSDVSTQASTEQVPHILACGLVTPKEVEELFRIYFDNMNLSASLLDPFLYTDKKTYMRSPFLFTVICAIASRFHPNRHLYDELMKHSHLAAGSALISGPKTVDVVAAYILLSLYPMPIRRWEEDRRWLYIGLAIRIATDINLHVQSNVKPRDEAHARELLNRTRVWINCHNLDRSTSSLHGKACTLSNTDYIASHSGTWYNASPYNMRNFDIHLAAYNAELRVTREWSQRIYSDPEHPTGLNKHLDISGITFETDDRLVALENEWIHRFDMETDQEDPQNRFRCCLIRLLYSTSRLVLLSFGFQHAGRINHEQNPFFYRCLNVASDLVRLYTEELSEQKTYMRHGLEGQFVLVTFAAAFMIKLLHAKYVMYLEKQQRIDIRARVQRLMELLGSPDSLNDERHSSRLWAKFLEGLLATPMAQVELSPSALKAGHALLHRRSNRRQQRGGGTDQAESPPTTVTLPPQHAEGHTPPVALGGEEHNASEHDFTEAEFSPTPLALDADFLQNMCAMEDATTWQDVMLSMPSFQWMSGQTTDNDLQMQTVNPQYLEFDYSQPARFTSY